MVIYKKNIINEYIKYTTLINKFNDDLNEAEFKAEIDKFKKREISSYGNGRIDGANYSFNLCIEKLQNLISGSDCK